MKPQEDPELLTRNLKADHRPIRVALVGATGIGKHHAKWWSIEGAQVCAFAGTSAESVAKTRQALVDLFGFSGHGYTSLNALLEAEQPDVVDVCSPPVCHARHVREALEAGCHVLCEKPFVYDPARPCEVVLSEAQALAQLAKGKGLLLSVSTQYSAGARMFEGIWNERRPGEAVVHYHGHLESPAKNRPADPERVWGDLSPHPLSVLIALAPDGVVHWDTVQVTFTGYEALAEFDVRRPTGEILHALIVTRNAVQPPFNVRHFKYNGYVFGVEGQNDVSGVYCARIETANGHYLELDMMRALIRDFARGHPTAGIEESLKNLEWMLRIRDIARGQRHPG